MNHLLIVYHSKNGGTAEMARAVLRGALHPDITIEVRFKLARDAGVDDLLWANALILGTPENFGYMSGALKDFFDRTYYPVEGKVEGLPYALFVSAGNDGQGAVTSVQRIVRGYPFREVQPPLISRGDVTPEMQASCEELGMYMAAGTESNLF